MRADRPLAENDVEHRAYDASHKHTYLFFSALSRPVDSNSDVSVSRTPPAALFMDNGQRSLSSLVLRRVSLRHNDACAQAQLVVSQVGSK